MQIALLLENGRKPRIEFVDHFLERLQNGGKGVPTIEGDLEGVLDNGYRDVARSH